MQPGDVLVMYDISIYRIDQGVILTPWIDSVCSFKPTLNNIENRYQTNASPKIGSIFQISNYVFIKFMKN